MSGPSDQDQLRGALEHHRAGRLAEAEAAYRQILTKQPNHPDALHLLGAVAQQVGKHALAIELIGRAVQLQPGRADFHNNLGRLRRAAGDLQGAAAEFEMALRLRPAYPDAQQNMADALADLVELLLKAGDLPSAVEAGQHAVRVWPASARGHHNLGTALHQQRKLDEAIAEYREAIRLTPQMPEPHNNLGNALRDVGRIDTALESYRRAIDLRPGEPLPHSNLICAMLLDDRPASGALRQELNRFNDRHAEPLKKLIRPHAGNRDPDRPLSIGYVSPNLRDHVIGRNMLPLLRHHDRERFRIVCYSDGPAVDAVAIELRQYSDEWNDVSADSNDALAERIRNDRIDILVDLALHLKGNRLLVFAQKPALVQINFAGYPGSTGLTAIDYRLTDPYLDPPDADESACSEKSIRLPNTFWCYEPMADSPPVNPLPADTAGHITFGCLSDFAKVTPTTLGLWKRVMDRVAGSMLVMLAPEGSCRQEIVQSLGIAPSRVHFVDRQPRMDYLRTYHRIDIGLDTFPYNGHTTSLDAVWMGVPVVSLYEQPVVSRAGLSQASNIGLPDLVTDDPEVFVEIAMRLASDRTRLRELRSSLRQRIAASPLMDGERFARDIESAYRQAWREAGARRTIG